MSDKRYSSAKIDRLRSPERIEFLEVNKVVDLCLKNHSIVSVLDAGTGSGLFAEAFHARGLAVEGIDVSPEMIAFCTSTLPMIPFKVGSIEEIPYPDNSFDMLFLGLVFHESDNPEKAIKESKRVSRNQICILEWPYIEQSFGPPLAHRLTKDEIIRIANSADIHTIEEIQLQNLRLYRLFF